MSRTAATPPRTGAAVPEPLQRYFASYWKRLFIAVGLADNPWEPAVLLDGNKKFCGRMPIPDAVAVVDGTWDSLRHSKQDIRDDGQAGPLARCESARTLVIRAGKDVLSIDGDDASEIPSILTLYRTLRVADRSAIMLASGRVPDIPNQTSAGPNPFGLHLWAWGLSVDQVDQFKRIAKELDLRWSPFLRAPWSPHPSGATMQSFQDPDDRLNWMHQTVAVALLEERGRQRLHAGQEDDNARDLHTNGFPTVDAPEHGGRHDLPHPLPEKWHRLLSEGVSKGRRSAEVGRFLMAAANAGWSWPAVQEALTDPKNGLSDRILEQRGDRLRWLEIEWERACTKVMQAPALGSRADVLDEIDRLMARAHAVPLKVASHQLVYEDHLKVAKRLGSLEYRLDVRTQAENTGYCIKTVSFANDAIETDGRLQVLERGQPHHATRYRLVPRGNNLYPPRGELIVSSRISPSHDLWRHRLGLGKVRFKVYRLLDRVQTATIQEVAVALRYRSSKTPVRHLRILEVHGLAEEVSGGWRRGPADLDLVAVKLGAYGKGVREHDLHQRQRQEYARNLKDIPCPDCGEIRQGIPRIGGNLSRCRECRPQRARRRGTTDQRLRETKHTAKS